MNFVKIWTAGSLEWIRRKRLIRKSAGIAFKPLIFKLMKKKIVE